MLFKKCITPSLFTPSSRPFTSANRDRYAQLLKDLTQTVQFDSQNRISNIPESPFVLDPHFDHAPKRTHTLSPEQVDLAIKNHLKYFAKDLHPKLS